MGDERSYPGVYLDEGAPASSAEGVPTEEGASTLGRLVRFAMVAAAVIGYRALRRRRRHRL